MKYFQLHSFVYTAIDWLQKRIERSTGNAHPCSNFSCTCLLTQEADSDCLQVNRAQATRIIESYFVQFQLHSFVYVVIDHLCSNFSCTCLLTQEADSDCLQVNRAQAKQTSLPHLAHEMYASVSVQKEQRHQSFWHHASNPCCAAPLHFLLSTSNCSIVKLRECIPR
jgi:NADPH-dependent 7-cyano-7-deazaguanine reductase QueF